MLPWVFATHLGAGIQQPQDPVGKRVPQAARRRQCMRRGGTPRSQWIALTKSHLQRCRVLRQVDHKFIVCHAASTLFCVDQHAAHERIRLERLQVPSSARHRPCKFG